MRRALLSILLLAGCASARGNGAGAAHAPRTIGKDAAVVRGCIGEECGVLVNRFRIHLGRGDRVLLRAASDELDPVLIVSGPSGVRARVDDAFPDRRDAAVFVEASERGSYIVEVRGVSDAEEGLFDLHCTRYEDPPGAALSLDGTVDRQLPQGRLEWLHLRAEEGMLIRLRVTSADADPFVAVFAPTGRVYSNDDAYETGAEGDERRTDSTVRVAAPKTGVYLVAVGSYDGGPTHLRIATTMRPPVHVDDDDGPPATGWAGPRAMGRLYGLFVGIGAYPNAPLYGTADDASFLAEAFRAARLMRAEDQIVLRDAGATREALLSGIGTLVGRARPEDAVVVFYSGHGEARPAPEDGTEEVDGLDETLVLFDGELTDTELVRALDPIRASSVVLAVDACLSGGFADDFMRRPGRLGLFSSDDDVLSHTAEPHRAGGYLSHFLRRAVLGGADTRPRDGYLQAGELTDALYEGFLRDHRQINPGGEMQPLQRLVVDRGSMRWDEVLWAYPRDEDGTLPLVPDLALESRDPRRLPHH